MSFALLSPRAAAPLQSRGRLPRVLLSVQFLPVLVFPMPALVAEFFRGPLIAPLAEDVELLSDGRVMKDVTGGVKLATVGGAALVNPASPVTVRGRVFVRSQVSPAVPAGAKFRVLATAYSSTPDQTDASPFITASGTHVHDGTIATNFLPFGTHVRFLNYRPEMVFTVEDRHHPRLSDRVDLWFETREAAFRFGKRTLEMEVVP